MNIVSIQRKLDDLLYCHSMINLNGIWNILLKDPVVDISLEYLLEIRQILNYVESYINEWYMGRKLCSVPTGWDLC